MAITTNSRSRRRRARLVILRRVWTNIQTTRLSSAIGHDQPTASLSTIPGRTTSATATSADRTAGANAHRCGWPVHRMDRIASTAQAAEKAERSEEHTSELQ